MSVFLLPAHVIDVITVACARCFGVQLADVMAPDEASRNRRIRVRQRTVARTRMVAMALTRELTPMSFPAIGQYFGNRNHSTVISACRVVNQAAADDPLFASTLAALRLYVQTHLPAPPQEAPSAPAILPQVTQQLIERPHFAATRKAPVDRAQPPLKVLAGGKPSGAD